MRVSSSSFSSAEWQWEVGRQGGRWVVRSLSSMNLHSAIRQREVSDYCQYPAPNTLVSLGVPKRDSELNQRELTEGENALPESKQN